MNWAQWRDRGVIFQVRVAGVAVSEERVLLHRMVGEDHWSLPGGRLRVGETAEEALRREMREEIDCDVESHGLLWLIENFFDHPPLDHSGEVAIVAHHEIGLYLAMTLPDRFEATDDFTGVEVGGTAGPFRLEFRWVPLSEVPWMDVRPAELRERLTGTLPRTVPIVVSRG